MRSPSIQRLPAVLIDKIAAGEVIEAPYSVVKELIENSLDAGATKIEIETEAGGMKCIHVDDNGHGMRAEDMLLCLERHTTSKIRELEDLNQILSYGFRGEALSTIAAVSYISIRTRARGQRLGQKIECRGGKVLGSSHANTHEGTSIAVYELFYATPARRKFVKSERSENMRIASEIQRIAIAHPKVSFRYKRDGKERFFYSHARDVFERISQVFPKKLSSHLLEIQYESSGLELSGFITDENYYRANREGQFLYVNGRPVEIANFSWLVKKAYGELLPPNAHPYYFLFLNIDPARVDVNVHPRKKEVRLLDKSLLHGLVQNALSPVLRPRDPLAFRLSSASGYKAEAEQLPRLTHELKSMQGQLLAPRLESAERSFPVGSSFSNKSGSFAGSDVPTDAEASSKEPSIGNEADPETPARPFQSSEKFLHESFVPKRHFGIIFGTYILAEGEDAFYLIDQHTAHERVNFERKKRELESEKATRQALLTPVVLSYREDEKEEILSHKGELLEAGFLIEDYGPRSLAIRELPAYIEAGTETEVFLHLIRRILEGERGIRLYEEYAALRACKASIKKNDHVAGGVLSSILEELAACENPSRCPHGRPTMMKITRSELDQIFHRS